MPRGGRRGGGARRGGGVGARRAGARHRHGVGHHGRHHARALAHNHRGRLFHRGHRRRHFHRGGANITIGWSNGTPSPVEPTVFVNEVDYTVRCVFGTVVQMFDTTGDGMADQLGVDQNGDGVVNAVGVAMDTSGDGVADAVGIDTTGDGEVDSYIDLTLANGSKVSVRLIAGNVLQVVVAVVVVGGSQ